MKIKLLPMAIGAILATQFSIAQAAEVQVYGKVNTTANVNDNSYLGADQKDNDEINSNASRVGVKGDLNISEDLKGVYKLEYEVFVDDGVSGNNTGSDEFNARNMYGGLKSKTWGQIVAGKHDTPVKLSQGKIDLFNDLHQGDMNNYLVGENRMDNVLWYTTPTFSNFVFSLMTIAGEQAGVAASGPALEDNDLIDSVSGAIEYSTETLSGALSFDNDVNNTDIVRFVLSSTLAEKLTLNALYQTAEANDTDNDGDGTDNEQGEGIGGTRGISTSSALGLSIDNANNYQLLIEEQDAYVLSALYKIDDKWSVYAQYGGSESDTFDTATADGRATFDSDFIGVGVDYKLTKKVKLFAYLTQIDVEIDDSNAAVVADLKDDGDFETTGVGMEVNF